MSFKEKVMPALVLMIICAVISGLVIGVYNLTYVDNTGVLTDQLKSSLDEIFSPGGEYEILLTETDDGKLPVNFGNEDITAVIADKKNGRCAFEMTVDGYEKDGIHMLIGFDENGQVAGISYLELKETKGLGTKVEDEGFVSKFIGFDSESSVDEVDNVTGATFSSKGVKGAVAAAADSYSEHKEEIFSE